MIAQPDRSPREPAPAPTANDRLKASFDGVLWGSLITATFLHFALFALWPAMVAPDVSLSSAAVETLELPPEVEIPEAPRRLTRPAAPVPTPDVAPEATMPTTRIEDHPPATLPPPAPRGDEGARPQPGFTPYTLAPRILNPAEVVRAMERAYPDILREAGLGGTVRVHLYVDENGVVQETRIAESSGHARLDEAALGVADVYRFSPALNRDTRVAVWISLPITFQVN